MLYHEADTIVKIILPAFMNPPIAQYTLQQKVFLLLLTLVTIGFVWILLP